MPERKCANCGGVLKPGTYVCEYCGTDWSPPEAVVLPSLAPEAPAAPAAWSAPRPLPPSQAGKVFLFLFLLLFCMPASLIYLWAALPWSKRAKTTITLVVLAPLVAMLVFGLFYETVYAVRSEAPKVSLQAVPVAQRPVQNLDLQQVLRRMSDLGDRSLMQRKEEFRKDLMGRWVQWEGTVTSTSISTSSASTLKMHAAGETSGDLELFFGPEYKDELQALSAGDRVRFSGMIWGGYFFSGPQVRLSDGAILKVTKGKKLDATP